MNILTIGSIILTVGFGIISLYFGEKYKQVKKVLKNLVNMIEDDKISEEELKTFLISIKDLINYD